MGDKKIVTPAPEDLENYKDMDVGDILRRTRLHYGQSLKDIESALRIRESQLRAIENGEVEKLPGRVYAVGFVRTYAEFLGLDGAKIAQLFVSQHMESKSKDELSFPLPASESRTPSGKIVIVSLVLIIAVFAGWSIFNSSSTKITTDTREIPSVPDSVRSEMSANNPSVPTESVFGMRLDSGEGADSASAVDGEDGIVLNMIKESWVLIKDADGNTVLSETLTAGDKYFLPNNPGLTMTLGNAKAVEIVINGHALMPLGADDEVINAVPLDVSYLKTLEFQKPDVTTSDIVEEADGVEPPDSDSLNDSGPAEE